MSHCWERYSSADYFTSGLRVWPVQRHVVHSSDVLSLVTRLGTVPFFEIYFSVSRWLIFAWRAHVVCFSYFLSYPEKRNVSLWILISEISSSPLPISLRLIFELWRRWLTCSDDQYQTPSLKRSRTCRRCIKFDNTTEAMTKRDLQDPYAKNASRWAKAFVCSCQMTLRTRSNQRAYERRKNLSWFVVFTTDTMKVASTNYVIRSRLITSRTWRARWSSRNKIDVIRCRSESSREWGFCWTSRRSTTSHASVARIVTQTMEKLILSRICVIRNQSKSWRIRQEDYTFRTWKYDTRSRSRSLRTRSKQIREVKGQDRTSSISCSMISISNCPKFNSGALKIPMIRTIWKPKHFAHSKDRRIHECTICMSLQQIAGGLREIIKEGRAYRRSEVRFRAPHELLRTIRSSSCTPRLLRDSFVYIILTRHHDDSFHVYRTGRSTRKDARMTTRHTWALSKLMSHVNSTSRKISSSPATRNEHQWVTATLHKWMQWRVALLTYAFVIESIAAVCRSWSYDINEHVIIQINGINSGYEQENTLLSVSEQSLNTRTDNSFMYLYIYTQMNQ